jgi:hypothetical protein
MNNKRKIKKKRIAVEKGGEESEYPFLFMYPSFPYPHPPYVCHDAPWIVSPVIVICI